jgi:AraC-like DNA-binding protein
MNAMRLPQEFTTGSCSERIAHLAVALLQTGLRTRPSLGGVHILEALPQNARLCNGATCVVILCSRDRLRHIDDVLHHSYLVQTAITPADALVRQALDGGKAACLAVQFDLQVAAELIVTLDEMHQYPVDAPAPDAWIALEAGMEDAVQRLLQAMHCPADALVLGPGIVRELLYRVLTGPLGAAVRAALSLQGSTRRIGKALRRIQEAYADAVDVAALANEAGMSVAAFHAHFKAVTQTTPIQFLKSTRLQRARLLMQEGLSAAHASRLVGYESNSQFSREFKRLFGRTPSQEAAHIKALCPGNMAQATQAGQHPH